MKGRNLFVLASESNCPETIWTFPVLVGSTVVPFLYALMLFKEFNPLFYFDRSDN
ncbi:MAG: hypothetical protein WD048_14425 [Chitinophagales bacterium]